MGCPSYLLKKQDIYYFRQACPSSVKSKIGKSEIIRSLGVRDKSIAIRMARECKICLDHLIDCLLIQGDYQIKPLAYIEDNFRRIRDNYVNGNGAPIPLSIITTVDMKENDSIVQCNVDNKTENVVLSDENLTNSQPTTDIEPLFEKFKTEKVRLKRWSIKTQNEKNGHFSLLLSILKYTKDTNTIYIEQIQKTDIRQLKEILLLLPKNYNKKFPNLSLSEVIKLCNSIENNEIDALTSTNMNKINEKISISTISDKYSSTIKGFWQWLNDQSYIDSNVFSILKFDAKKTCNSWETLTKVDLEHLFNDNIFKKKNYRYSYQYWLPLLACYTSARLTELCQLRSEHIVLGEHPYINIVAGKDTSLKTINSKRTIPIHNDLIICGFIDYVEYLIKNNIKYLFPELKGQDGTTNSKRVSKWFNERFRIKHEIGTGKSFHSFRRTFINEMSNNGATDSEIRMFVGHKPDKQDTLNNHYKDELSIKDKSLFLLCHITHHSADGTQSQWMLAFAGA